MQMPGMDGVGLGQAIRKNKHFADLPLVILTSLGMPGDARRFEEMGFAAYVTKPVRPKELQAVLNLVLSSEGKGTHPIITRYLALEAQQRSLPGGHGRILLAEDTPTSQQVALSILRKLGFQADLVNNGEEALNALADRHYDLVLMDLQMPEMDGLEATRRIRNAGDRAYDQKVPIIAMTAHAMQGDRERCLQAGMNDYISKPVSPAALSEALSRWMPKEGQDGVVEDNKMAPERAPQLNSNYSRSRGGFDSAELMRVAMDDLELAQDIAECFLNDMPLQLKRLHGFLKDRNSQAIARQAHSIKGAAAAVAATYFKDRAYELEQAARINDLATAEALVDDLELQFKDLKKTMMMEFNIDEG